MPCEQQSIQGIKMTDVLRYMCKLCQNKCVFAKLVKCCNIVANSWHWQSIDDSVMCKMPTTNAEYRQLLADYDLCLTGQVVTNSYLFYFYPCCTARIF